MSDLASVQDVLHAESRLRVPPHDETRLREFGRIGLTNGSPDQDRPLPAPDEVCADGWDYVLEGVNQTLNGPLK